MIADLPHDLVLLMLAYKVVSRSEKYFGAHRTRVRGQLADALMAKLEYMDLCVVQIRWHDVTAEYERLRLKERFP